MYLYYDTISKVYSLKTDEGVKFLGPFVHTMLVLREEHGLTESQAREAATQAMFNRGQAVHIEDIKRIASPCFQ